MNSGNLKQGIRLSENTLAAKRKVLGKDHPDTIRGMGVLALHYKSAGRWSDAAELLQVDAIPVCSARLGESS
ncbi:MAG: tetratricopeptide repeat protein, partial [Planctomycetota bacterium]